MLVSQSGSSLLWNRVGRLLWGGGGAVSELFIGHFMIDLTSFRVSAEYHKWLAGNCDVEGWLWSVRGKERRGVSLM